MANPVTEDLHLPAHKLAAKIVSHLYESWGPDPEGLRLSKEVDLCVMFLVVVHCWSD
jgi:hypothetical protein